MAKKYLLYIHDERFDNEDNKSALVNSLLESHYKGYKRETITDAAHAERVVKDLLSKKPVSKNIRPKIKAVEKGECRNGHLLGRLGKCLEKGCKYS